MLIQTIFKQCDDLDNFWVNIFIFVYLQTLRQQFITVDKIYDNLQWHISILDYTNKKVFHCISLFVNKQFLQYVQIKCLQLQQDQRDIASECHYILYPSSG